VHLQDQALFPDLHGGRILTTLAVNNFEMTFPVPERVIIESTM
jgi:hypothetical protein